METESKLKYYLKYSAGTYADCLLSIPIEMAELTAKTSERIFKEKNPKLLSLEHIERKSPLKNTRRKLRNNLDTRPGALFIQSNIIAAAPFFFAGMPAAELAQEGINAYLSDFPEISKNAINSGVTLLSQMITGYSAFMVNEVRTNREKYIDGNGKLSLRKIGNGFIKTVKAFLSFDIPYTLGKLGGQSYLLSKGKDPWIASGIFDTFAMPAFFAAVIPLGLKNGVIETEETRKWEEMGELERKIKTSNIK